ncbi:oxygenase MpaB family protein [Jongsikchunia kroppenstedtii]|uniref:oxygenase MpaB family protein n=1 Tax=Jongsikchunia kroppenstedtii TaxID=1121721 RepID=UPI000367680B|nr:oxygenase MpaB family protein [Jongsikchunia kroppenstedtii]
MTITVSHAEQVEPVADVEPWRPGQPHAELAADARWWLGSPMSFGLFGRLALDQVAYRPVAAAVDRSGRFRENFADRGIRSYAYAMLLLFGDDRDRQRDTEELKRLHRDVRGAGNGEFADTRYSALDPHLWRWIAVSGINLFYRGYIALHGDLDAEQREVVYRTVRWMHSALELPSGQTTLPRTTTEMMEYYDSVAAEHLADNGFLLYARRSFNALPMPSLLSPKPIRVLMRPLWSAVVPVALRAPRLCAESQAHPRMRELLGCDWTWRDRLEYRLYLTGARLAWRHLPRRLVLDPLVYNRYRYERLRGGYRRMQLDSFAA